jgi:hypothetical protein
MATVAAALLFAGCGKPFREGSGPSFLILDQLLGANGATPGTVSNVVQSDVQTFVSRGSGRVPTVFEDPGRGLFHVQLKDLGTPTNPNTPTPNNNVTITRYRVDYIRADGRNTPGVDVPYGFDGAATSVITAAGGAVDFTLVRVQAKSEAPLMALIGNGGAQVISAIAQVTFYGHDTNGNTVTVTGNISVTFSDWGDPS